MSQPCDLGIFIHVVQHDSMACEWTTSRGFNSTALNPPISYSQPLTHSRHTAYFKQQEAVSPPAALFLVFTSSEQANNGSPAGPHGLRLHNHLCRHHRRPRSMAFRCGGSSNLSVPLPTQARS